MPKQLEMYVYNICWIIVKKIFWSIPKILPLPWILNGGPLKRTVQLSLQHSQRTFTSRALKLPPQGSPVIE